MEVVFAPTLRWTRISPARMLAFLKWKGVFGSLVATNITMSQGEDEDGTAALVAFLLYSK